MSKSCYLSGPMRGKPLFNFPAFDAAAKNLRAQGWAVFNPAEADRSRGFDPATDKAHDTAFYMGVDLPEVCKCDCVITLPGWEKSEGCDIEFTVARKLKKPIFSYETGWELSAHTSQPRYIETWVKKRLTTKFDVARGIIPVVFEEPASLTKPAPSTQGVITDCALRIPQRDDRNPKDLLGALKPCLNLIPPVFLILVAKVMELGAKKYSPYNWRAKKVLGSIYLAAAMRHILSYQDGEDNDPESGTNHLAHAAACMGIMLDAAANDCLVDDRPIKGKAAEVIRQLTVKQSQGNV